MPRKKPDTIDELKVIDDLSTLFSSTLNLKDTLQETIHLISKLTKADACFLYLYDIAERDLYLAASKPPHPQEIGQLRLKLNQGIAGWVAKHNKIVALPKNAHKDPRFIGTLPEDQFQALISVPIRAKNNVVGVINAQNKKPTTYPARLVNLLTTIGKQVGGAIETARLYDETRRRAKTLEALNAVSQTLTQDGPDQIMQMIIEMTAKMLGSTICSVMLLDEKHNELRITASQSLDPEYRNKPAVKVNGSLSGKAIQTLQPIVVKDCRNEKSYQYRDLAIKQGLVAMLTVPMVYQKKALGVINVYKPEEYSFTKEEISFVQSIGHQCAAAIENTRLLSEKLAAQEALETRKVVERAKGILMNTKGFTEPQAFREIQRQSMDRRKSMKEIADAIILAHEMVQ